MTAHHPLAAPNHACRPSDCSQPAGLKATPATLAVAICLVSNSLYADTHADIRTDTDTDARTATVPQQAVSDSLSPQYVDYPYLNWYPRSLLSAAERANLPEFCRGLYQGAEIQPLGSDAIVAEADEAQIDKSGNAFLQGDVRMQRDSYLLQGDSASWQQRQGQGQLTGQVTIYTPWSTLHSKEALFTAQTQGQPDHLNLKEAAYALPQYHIRGEAESIQTRASGEIRLEQASMTFCEPGQNDWDIVASRINLDQKRGIGSAWHTRLRVLDVPVIYLPYYRFPIDDRRTTGFLDPSFSVNGKGQLADFQAPFYINIAPNMDATIIPHHLLDRGLLWESQFRHKTALFGDGELNYGYLNKDQTDDIERWGLNYSQQGNWGQHWSHQWVYNHVSDDDYLSDLNSASGIDRTTHLPRRGEIRYRNHRWTGTLMAESFQTIDGNLNLQDRPYKRLPQAEIRYQSALTSAWQFDQTVQLSRFRRQQQASINGSTQRLSGFDGLYGQRWVADSALRWHKQWPYAHITPSVEWRYRQYDLSHDHTETLSDSQPMSDSYGVPRYQLDTGLVLERPLDWQGQAFQQTLEPRLLWVKSPYKAGQTDIPAFDSGHITTDYQSLFQGDRFTGYDRLADLNQLSLGVTTRFLNQTGRELLNASLGRIHYWDDRRVTLNASDATGDQATSSTIGEINWYPSDYLSLFHTLEWDAYDDFARQKRFGARYNDSNNHMISLSSNKLQTIDSNSGNITTELHQLDANAFWSLSDRWAVIGRVLLDQNHYESDVRSPESSVLEALAGFEYQNCCWRLQVLYRETSPAESDLNATHSTDNRHSLMFSIQLKGLSTLGGGTDSILSQSINGYSRRQYHDY